MKEVLRILSISASDICDGCPIFDQCEEGSSCDTMVLHYLNEDIDIIDVMNKIEPDDPELAEYWKHERASNNPLCPAVAQMSGRMSRITEDIKQLPIDPIMLNHRLANMVRRDALSMIFEELQNELL